MGNKVIIIIIIIIITAFNYKDVQVLPTSSQRVNSADTGETTVLCAWQNKAAIGLLLLHISVTPAPST